MSEIPTRQDFGNRSGAGQKLLALLLAVPIAWGVYQGLLWIRGPEEVFEEENPLTPRDEDGFRDAAALTPWPHAGDWPMFGHDPLHTGRSPADFRSADLVPAWAAPFAGDGNDHVWRVEPGSCVWSPPVIGRIPFPDGRTVPMLFLGSYDRSLYALDARTGIQMWRHGMTAGSVYSAPALAMVAGRPVVYAASTDRVIYALDARTGEKVWARETRGWSQSVTAAQMSSPTPINLYGRTVVLVGVWNSDRSGTENVQDGELLALDAATGADVWRVRLGTSPVTTPAAAKVRGGQIMAFAASDDGSLRAFDARSGQVLWQRPLHQELRSSPSLALTPDGVPTVMIGTRFHTIYGLSAPAGRKLWMYQTGYWVDGTPATAEVDGEVRVFAGSYNHYIYALDVASKGRVRNNLWAFEADNVSRSSPAVASVAGRPAVFQISYDVLHLLDAADGKRLWNHKSGPLLFSHEFQGDSLWSSPAVADWGTGAHVFFPAHDGKLYAFRSR